MAGCFGFIASWMTSSLTAWAINKVLQEAELKAASLLRYSVFSFLGKSEKAYLYVLQKDFFFGFRLLSIFFSKLYFIVLISSD